MKRVAFSGKKEKEKKAISRISMPLQGKTRAHRHDAWTHLNRRSSEAPATLSITASLLSHPHLWGWGLQEDGLYATCCRQERLWLTGTPPGVGRTLANKDSLGSKQLAWGHFSVQWHTSDVWRVTPVTWDMASFSDATIEACYSCRLRRE